MAVSQRTAHQFTSSSLILIWLTSISWRASKNFWRPGRCPERPEGPVQGRKRQTRKKCRSSRHLGCQDSLPSFWQTTLIQKERRGDICLAAGKPPLSLSRKALAENGKAGCPSRLYHCLYSVYYRTPGLFQCRLGSGTAVIFQRESPSIRKLIIYSTLEKANDPHSANLGAAHLYRCTRATPCPSAAMSQSTGLPTF